MKENKIKGHDDLDPLCTNIVYCIYYTNGQMYIGKRTVRSISVLPVLKTKARDNSVKITRHILRDENGNILTSKGARKEARAMGT